MESQTTFTLKPSKLRYLGTIYLWILFLCCLGILAGIISNLVSFTPLPTLNQIIEQGMYSLLVPCVFSLMFVLRDVKVYTITISEGMIEGPFKQDIWKKARFPLDRLIAPAATPRDFLQKIEGQRVLCSLDGERILLNEIVFSPAQIRALLQQLNSSAASEHQTVLNLEPSQLYYVGSKCLLLGGGYALGLFASIIFDWVRSVPVAPLGRALEHFGYFLVGELIAALLFSFFDIKKYAVLLHNDILTGPSKKDVHQRTSFAIDQLDPTATGERGFFEKIVGERVLRSFGDEKILLNEAVFPPAQVRALLQQLNVTKD